MGSTIITLQDNVSQNTDDKTDNEGGNKNRMNNNGGGNNNNGGNNNGGNNSQNCNGGGNNRSNRGNFDDFVRRRGAFYYMTTARVATTKIHDKNHVPNTTKPDTMACTESESHVDTNCAEKKMTLLLYAGYK